MTGPARRYQHAAIAGAIVLAAAAAGSAAQHALVPACLFGLGVLVLTEAALREHRRLKRRRLEADWTRARALGHTPAPLTPCCLLNGHAEDIHDQNCTSGHTLAAFLDRIEQQHRRDE
ncbi:hypothetical protein SZN_09411 [Streptomyces zinciresistens K42]|uniref:Integral membrane protein n=1 Tax=Streptomyces zinciresistens K42 TaxID=700597 RepID=G2G8R4_9ACTN|nr:hypothetical protein [Streptomyces zinciresistens]EGX60129.1 hypothetical protein SZN_09411 [Streptomyces zinciresistens K42]